MCMSVCMTVCLSAVLSKYFASKAILPTPMQPQYQPYIVWHSAGIRAQSHGSSVTKVTDDQSQSKRTDNRRIQSARDNLLPAAGGGQTTGQNDTIETKRRKTSEWR